MARSEGTGTCPHACKMRYAMLNLQDTAAHAATLK